LMVLPQKEETETFVREWNRGHVGKSKG
jgi:hypothetical protein